MKFSRLPLFFAFGKVSASPRKGHLRGHIRRTPDRRPTITPISRDILLIPGPSGHSPSAESLLLGAGDAHFVDGQPLKSPANGVGQQRNHVRQGGGPCGAVASNRQNAVTQVNGVGVARVFVTDHLVPMILHLRDFQMRRPQTLRCDHVEYIADRLRVASGFAKILPCLPRTFLTFPCSVRRVLLMRSNTSAGNLRWSRCNVSQIGGLGISGQSPFLPQAAPSSPPNRHRRHLAIVDATRPRQSHARARRPFVECRLPRRR